MPSLVADLLDTNIFVNLIRDNAIGQRLKRERQFLMTEVVPAYCIVTEGELRSLALQWAWGHDKLEQMRYLLDYFRPISIENPETIQAYAVIDAQSKSQGLTMGKNDVWIAAAAYVTGFELLTTDRDFDHLHGTLITRTLVDIQNNSDMTPNNWG